MKLKAIAFILCLLMGSMGETSAQGFLDKVLKGMEKTNKVLDEADKMLGGSNSNSSSQSSSRSKRVAGFQIVSPHPDIDVQFKRCIASSGTILIELMITNYSDDVNIDFNPYNNVVIDDQGKQYGMEVSVANGDWHSATSAGALFPTDVPIKLAIQIYNVPECTLEFKRIHLNVFCNALNLRGTSSEPIKLYNVPITRRTAQTVAPVQSDGEPTGMSELGETVISRHPLMDPLMNILGGHSSVYPTFLYYIQHEKNDWCVYGLRGKVKTLTEKYTDHNNQTTTYTYHFNENGYLDESIDWEKSTFLIVFSKSDPMNKKLYINKNGKNEEVKITDQDRYTFNEQGQLISYTLGEMKYSYDERGLCNQIQYEEEYPENMAKIDLNLIRNEQGDITRLDQTLTFYTEVYDQEKQKMTTGKQEGAPQKMSRAIQYVYDEQNNWTSCTSELCNIKRTIVYY